MNLSQRREIADRLRALLTSEEQRDLAGVAARLRVAEASLVSSLDADSPSQTVDVMVAFIRAYGVDPHWLLFGTYDAATHQQVLESSTGEVKGVVRKLAADGITKPPIAEPTEEKRRGG